MASDSEEEILRELCASINGLPISGFLRSRAFAVFCSEFGLQEIWDEAVAGEQRVSGRSGGIDSCDDHQLGTILCRFMIRVYDRRYADFTDIVSGFLKSAYTHTRGRFPFTEFDPKIIERIEAPLIELGNEAAEIRERFSVFRPENTR